ncbi:MAG: hypothetical protein PWQ15_275 [Methanobacterium sp.]|jgi:putative AdoMet-dependent methyltransferase|nr:hypothetical protein [Methanobacterium sp.]MDI3549173.1 hypothetical protein [Methanobacterium sp.]CDG64373.1 hypothetical protein MBMB1_0261 [Methanobacterium sp. MB1]
MVLYRKQSGVDYLDPEIAQGYNEEHQKFRNFPEEARILFRCWGLHPETL